MQTPETYVLILRLVLAGVLGGLGVCSLRAEGHAGGASQMKIRKQDGRVWLYFHGK